MVYLQHRHGYDRKPFKTQAAAIEDYRVAALELDRYGQKHDATMFLSDIEYPDFILTLTKHGNVRKTPA